MPNLKWIFLHNVNLVIVFLTLCNPILIHAGRKYTKEDILKLREEVREMFNHAYSGYLKYAYPYDELRPLTCDGVDTWGSYSLTLIDALDTLAVMGNYSEFRRVVDIVTSKANFDANINVSVFETNIRIVGGLLSAHLLSQRAGVDLEPGWPCNGPLLRLAEDVAKRLLAAFDTATGMPYGTVNLRYGVPHGETSITCTAGVGTYIIEFGALSRLTGDPIYEEVALNALHALYHHRSSIGLYGNHIDVMTGRWTAQDSGIGAGVDSYLEYLVKGALLVQRPELMAIFNEGRAAIDKHLKHNDWYLWVSMHKGQVTLPVFQSLEAYWPGVLSLIGDINGGMKSMHNYHQVWKQYGFTPEFYNIVQGQVGTNRESYPLRPELIESTMYLYRATKDPFLLDIGMDILRSIQHSSKTKCGYATIKDCRDHSLENRMESFFLAETTKYLFLLFDPDNFIHNDGQHGRVHTLPSGQECILDAGGYIFNTEAHPLDPGALLCCSENYSEPKRFNRAAARGEKLSSFAKKSKSNPAKNILQSELSSQLHSEEYTSTDNLPSAFVDNEELDSKVNHHKQNEALNIVKVPPPLDSDVQPIGDALSAPMSLNMLQMIEVLINSNIEKNLLKTTWSYDLLVELVEVIENTEKMLNQEKDKSTNVIKASESKQISSVLDSVENYSDTEVLNSSVVNKSATTLDINIEKNSFSHPSQSKREDRKTFMPDVELKERRNVTENHTTLSSLEDEKIEISSDVSDEAKELNKEKKENSLFREVITQQFKTIKQTILTETELIKFHLNKYSENLELTKNLAEVTNNHDLRTQFFTKRANVMVLALELKLSLEETKKLLNSTKSGENVTLDMFKRLIKLIVNGESVKNFLEKYNDFMLVSRKLIKIAKENLNLQQANSDKLLPEESMNNENDMNDSEELTNSFKIDSEESKNIFHTDNWKADDSSYQVDDKERVSLVSKIDSGPLFTERVKLKTEAVIGLLPQSLVSNERPFNPQMLLERIRDSPKYFRNTTWLSKYDLLTCTPQPYFTRIMLSGEFFGD